MKKCLMQLFAITLMLAFATTSYAVPTEGEFKTIMNLSGKQRMLSQKMVKEALLVIIGINADKNRSNLKATTDLFKKTLTGLKTGDDSLGLPDHGFRVIVKKLDKLEAEYNKVHDMFATLADGGELSAADLSFIELKNPEILTEANKIVSMFEIEAKAAFPEENSGLALIINLAGRQRMLSQKMTKEFLFASLDINKGKNSLSKMDTIDLFSKTLNGLISGDATLNLAGESDAAILAGLEEVRSIWKEFSGILLKEGEVTTDELNVVNDLSLKLLKSSNAVVQMYAK